MTHSFDSSRSSTDHTWGRRMAVLAAGVVASMALGGIQAPANAGTDAEWNRLANCESGQNWSINTGNGYYGGLQFAKGSWDWAGGTQYASYPHQATREEQIATAERLLDMQHVSRAWPACSARLGITHDQLQSGSATAPGGSSAPAQESASTGSSSSADGSHRVRAGDTLSRIAAQYGVSGGWSAIYQANRDRVSNPNLIRVGQVLRIPGAGGQASTPAPAAPEAPSEASAASGGTVTVRAGDTLWRIARDNGVSGGWSAIYAVNRDRVSNPNVIRVGQVLRLP